MRISKNNTYHLQLYWKCHLFKCCRRKASKAQAQMSGNVAQSAKEDKSSAHLAITVYQDTGLY